VNCAAVMLCKSETVVSDVDDHADLFAALVCAEFAFVNWR
jgi:hypothetical protein